MLLDFKLGNVGGLNVVIVESSPMKNRHYTIFSKVNTSADKSRSWPPTGLCEVDDLCFCAARMALCRPDQDQCAPVISKNLLNPGNRHIWNTSLVFDLACGHLDGHHGVCIDVYEFGNFVVGEC